jgi:CRP-like cAMP-binding protein
MIETKYLKDNIENIQKLMNIPALKHFEAQNLGKLLKLSKVREYDDGELIIREGDVDPWLYFLLSGKIKVVKDGVQINIIDKIGEIFGEMRIIDSMSRSASVYAIGKTICLAVDSSAKAKLSSDDKRDERVDFILLLYRIFAEYMSVRLRLTSEKLAKALNEIDDLKSKGA